MALRSKHEPWGKDPSNFSERENKTLQQGNACLQTVLRLFTAALSKGIRLWLENPQTSLLWKIPEVVQMIEKAQGRVITLSQCAFGSPYRKDTNFVFFNVDDSVLLPLQAPGRCRSRNKIRRFTGKPHRRTSPNQMEPGMFRNGFESREAAFYPQPLSAVLATVMATP